MNYLQDLLMIEGANSREIMQNNFERLTQPLAIIIILLILGALWYYSDPSEGILDILQTPFKIPIIGFNILFMVAVMIFGYLYPVDRTVWMLLAFIPILSMMFAVVLTVVH